MADPPDPVRTTMRAPRRSPSGAVTVGLVLIAVGVVLLLDNLGVVDGRTLLRGWWPIGVVLAGVWWTLTGARWTGVTVGAIGLLLLANAQGLIEAGLGSLVPPVVLLGLGAAMLHAGSLVRAARGADGRPLTVTNLIGPRDGARGWPRGEPSAIAVFGDVRLLIDDGGPVRVTTVSVFGDVRLEVPPGHHVVDHTTTVFGGVQVPPSRSTDPQAPRVELFGLVLFGEVQVRHRDGDGA